MNAKKLAVEYPSKLVVSAAEYHAHAAVGSSSLRTILKSSPAHFLYDRENPSESTPAQEFGTTIHQAILEPNVFKAQMVVKPKFAGTGSRAHAEAWALENHGKTIVTEDQLDIVSGILKSISKHSIASSILAGGASEESYFWRDADSGILCKCRPDFNREGRIVVDVKSTLDASYRSMQRDIANFKYHVQAAYYLDGITQVLGQTHDTFLILAVEKSAPYGVQVFEIDEATIEAGRQEYKRALMILKKCQETGVYPAYPDALTPLALPAWAWPLETE